MTTSQATCGLKESKRPCTLFTRRGEVKITANIDVVDIQMGEVIKTKMLNNTCIEEKQEKEKRQDAIDRDALFSR